MKKILSTLFIALYALCANAQLSQVMLSAEKGDIDAQKFLARSYSQGINGVRKNDVQAFIWTKAAAEQGDGEYEYLLSQLYWNGVGTSKDSNAMMEWMERSANHGYAPAMENLGFLNFMGGIMKRQFHY